MAALAADLNISTYGPIIEVPIKAAAVTFFQGAIVWSDLDGVGYATDAPAAGDRILGVSLTKQVNATAGDEVSVMVFGVVKFFAAVTDLATTDAGAIVAFDATTLTDNITDAQDATGLTFADNFSILGKSLDTDA
ncbi:MAG: hypothetical protein OEQ13_15215, partial [Acidobacteriota bacterium]|nr:hypothetical protein [Acidobacteriota bacterium]